MAVLARRHPKTFEHRHLEVHVVQTLLTMYQIKPVLKYTHDFVRHVQRG